MPPKYYNGNAARNTEVKGKAPAKIGGVLESALKRFGLDQDIARYQFVLHWDEIVGRDIALRTRPESLRNGLLRVRVADSVWAQELSFHKPVIMKRLRKFLEDEQIVSDVMFYVGPITD